MVPGLVLVALALRLYGLKAGLPEVYEEAYPFKKAWAMWGFGPGRGLDLNPHWFRYPGLTIELQFLGQGLLYLILRVTGAIRSTLDFRVLQQLDPTAFYVMGRSITALLGALTVVPVFRLTRRVAGRGAAIAAAVLVAVSPPLIAKSQLIEVDVPLTLFVAWSLLAVLDLTGGLTRRRALVAGVTIGLATAAKYPGIALAIPFAVAIAVAGRPAEGAPERRSPRGREAPIGWPAALGFGAAAMLATLFVASPYLFLDLRAALADLAVEREHMRLGHFGSDLGSTWMTYARDWCTAVAGGPVALASLAGLVLFVARRRAWALVAGSFMLAYAALVSSFAMKADRYLLPLLPPAFVFACALAAEAGGRVAPAAARAPAGGPAAAARPGGGRAGLVFTALAAVFVLAALAGLPAHLETLRPDTRSLARAWFEANVPEGSFVVSEPYGPPLRSPLALQAMDRDLLPALQARGDAHRIYPTLEVPMFQVNPARSAVFYDPSLYRMADAFVVTGAARDRYRAEPARFRAQLALYDTLEASWVRWHEFPANGGPGPAIVVYRNPAQPVPFAARRPSPGAPPRLRDGPPTGGEAYFYYAVGLDYELFGFLAPAMSAYLEGMKHLAAESGPWLACVERAANLLGKAGRPGEAADLLERSAAAATRPEDAARLRGQLARLRAGTR